MSNEQSTPYAIQGARIAAARTEKGMSQSDLAIALRQYLTTHAVKPGDSPEDKKRILRSAAQSTISRWEQGQVIPKGNLLLALSSVLTLEIPYILAVPSGTADAGRSHPETTEADEAARLIDDMTPRTRRIAISILRVLSER